MSDSPIDRFTSVLVNNSITNNTSVVYDDLNAPYTLLEWLEKTELASGSPDRYIDQYNIYVQDWRSTTNNKSQQSKTTIRDVYIRFLKEVVTNYTTIEEKRYISNIDFTNKAEADTVIPFFASRIREIIQFIVKKRHGAKFQKIKYSLKGTSRGLDKILYDTIVSFVSKDDIVSTRGLEFPKINEITSGLRISFNEIYDLSSSYYDTQYLYTESSEFLTSTGINYQGYYHIYHKNDGSILYMAGKEHISADHDTLTRIDYTIPLKSQQSVIKHGADNIIDFTSSNPSVSTDTAGGAGGGY